MASKKGGRKPTYDYTAASKKKENKKRIIVSIISLSLVAVLVLGIVVSTAIMALA
ncbi:MAG: hypothetical protein GX896_04205 [Clostridiales bacterium]|nr:hypothetical protein [Clostridiales bacterium]